MPKIIRDLENRLIEEAKKQIGEVGYAATTIRSVARACGVGVGTVYNYFPSKDAMLASYMLSDWNQRVTAIEAVSACSDDPKTVVRCVYDQLLTYAKCHAAIFRDPTAAAGFAGSFGRYHGLLRSQLALPLRKFCQSDFAADFAAESLLTWTMAGTDFDTLYGMIVKLL